MLFNAPYTLYADCPAKTQGRVLLRCTGVWWRDIWGISEAVVGFRAMHLVPQCPNIESPKESGLIVLVVICWTLHTWSWRTELKMLKPLLVVVNCPENIRVEFWVVVLFFFFKGAQIQLIKATALMQQNVFSKSCYYEALSMYSSTLKICFFIYICVGELRTSACHLILQLCATHEIWSTFWKKIH